MSLISHIVISEVNRAHRAKVKRTQAAVDRAVQAVMAREPGRPLWPTAEELARQQRGRNGR
jgi:hypothetical protein